MFEFFVTNHGSRQAFRELVDRQLGRTPMSVWRGESPVVLTETLEEIKARVRIERLVRRYVRLEREGDDYVGSCPLHPDPQRSLIVEPGSQCFRCGCCGASGDVLSFLMRVENIGLPDAISQIDRLAGLP